MYQYIAERTKMSGNDILVRTTLSSLWKIFIIHRRKYDCWTPGLFSAERVKSVAEGTNLGVSHIEIELYKTSPKVMIRTPLGRFVNHQPSENIQCMN